MPTQLSDIFTETEIEAYTIKAKAKLFDQLCIQACFGQAHPPENLAIIPLNLSLTFEQNLRQHFRWFICAQFLLADCSLTLDPAAAPTTNIEEILEQFQKIGPNPTIVKIYIIQNKSQDKRKINWVELNYSNPLITFISDWSQDKSPDLYEVLAHIHMYIHSFKHIIS